MYHLFIQKQAMKKDKKEVEPVQPPASLTQSTQEQEAPIEDWELYMDEIKELIDWTPAQRGKSEATQEDKDNFIKLLATIASHWCEYPSSVNEVMMRSVGITLSAYHKYLRMNPRVADYIGGLKSSGIQKSIRNAISFIDKVLEKPEEYDDKTVMQCAKIVLSHKEARALGFARETDVKVFNIVDKTSPLPQFDKSELEDV